MLVFLSVIETFIVVFRPRTRSFYLHLLKEPLSHCSNKKIHNARSLQENDARSEANQSARTIVAI